MTIPEISRYLNECTKISKPEIGSLVHLWNGHNGHIAVVTDLNPIKVTDRNGVGGEIRENIPLTDVLFKWGGSDIVVHYLRPQIQSVFSELKGMLYFRFCWSLTLA